MPANDPIYESIKYVGGRLFWILALLAHSSDANAPGNDNVVPFPGNTKEEDICTPDEEDDDGCKGWYEGLLAIYNGILNGTENSDDLTKQFYNRSAKKYNQLCAKLRGHPPLPLFVI